MSTMPVSYPPPEQRTTPFGLPAGSVRGMMSLLICIFFWLVLLWPTDQPIKPPLGHFFLLGLVFLAFSTAPSLSADEVRSVLPWLLRVLFVAGSIAVIVFVAIQHPDRLKHRLTPSTDEVGDWWQTFLICTVCGFAGGLMMRFILGRESYVFRSLRAWLGIVALVMICLEIGLFIMFVTSESRYSFLQLWEAIELVVVSAYFGSRV